MYSSREKSKWTQELIQSDSHQVFNIKGKGEQKPQNEQMTTLSPKAGNSVTKN